MKKFISILFPILIPLLFACNNNGIKADAYGNFETDELTVSSEASGKILWLSAAEGNRVDSAAVVGLIDTIQIALKRKQVEAQMQAVLSRLPNIAAQADVHSEQIKVLEVERNRISNMLADGAATRKQLDDVEGKISLARKQIDAINSQRISIKTELEVLQSQITQLQDQQARCKIFNPINGVVLSRFAQQGELIQMGRPIYKIANLDYLYLKVFISGSQLHEFKIGNNVYVYIDGHDSELIEHKGTVSWVSSNAEFTPKIIQTREERVKMVYAVKIRVKNDGSLKIGMPGEVRLMSEN
jgi:HlyD family secretion protein